VAQGGFTLLEIMVALAVIAVAFVALLGLRNRDIVLHDEARAVIMATALAQQRMADATIGVPRPGDQRRPVRRRARAVYVAAGGEPPGLFSTDLVREVRVMVAWGEPSRNERVDLVSYVFQRPKTGAGMRPRGLLRDPSGVGRLHLRRWRSADLR
jgi:general secretion pathway protein I